MSMLNSFQLTLFYKYAELLKRRFSDDFQEVCFPIPPTAGSLLTPLQDRVYR